MRLLPLMLLPALLAGCAVLASSPPHERLPRAVGYLHVDSGTDGVLPGQPSAGVAEQATSLALATASSASTRERAIERVGPLGEEGHIEVVSPSPGLLEVRVWDESPERAAGLCNAILDATVQQGLERRRAQSDAGLQWLNEAIETEQRKPSSVQDRAALERSEATLRQLFKRRTEIELQRAKVQSDVRVLDRCGVPRR